LSWWRFGKRPEETIPDLKPYRREEPESLSPRREDRILALQRSVGNQAVKKMVPQAEGEAIPEGDRQNLEASFGADLSEVRLHRDQQAAELTADAQANAFTTGRDIYFAPGAYGPATLAHEVSHAIQQGQAVAESPGEEISLEHEADVASSAVVSGHAPKISSLSVAPAVQRQAVPGAGSSSMKLMPSETLTLDNFDIDKFILSSSHMQKLDEFAKRLKNSLSSAPDTFVSIVGFADAPGTEPHNVALGQQRAQAVLDYLVAKGVPANILTAASLGEQVPVVESKGYEAKNRRVEIYVHERSFFKPSISLTPPAPLPTPTLVPPKPIDLTYHPPVHMPTPEEEVEENIRRNEEIWKQAQEVLAREKAQPGKSAADLFGKVAREVTKKLGLPKWVQDRAESLAQDVPSKGAQAVFDQITGDKNLDGNAKNAIKAIIDALMQTKVK
jgi:outer membrane protein OmpA-like peptidoglycan-associated protein